MEPKRPIIEPRLRLIPVFLRGLAYGAVIAPVVLLPVLFNPDHDARVTYVTVLSALGIFAGGPWLLMGLFFWACCRGDIRRWRDWRTASGRNDTVCFMAPALVRTAAAFLVLAGAGWTFHALLTS